MICCCLHFQTILSVPFFIFPVCLVVSSAAIGKQWGGQPIGVIDISRMVGYLHVSRASGASHPSNPRRYKYRLRSGGRSRRREKLFRCEQGRELGEKENERGNKNLVNIVFRILERNYSWLGSFGIFLCFVCFKVKRPCQQLRSCRAGQLPINSWAGLDLLSC